MKIMCDTFNLGSITTSIFCYRVDCILMGMNLIKVPGRTGYKLFFSIYPLWRQSLKACLGYPSFLQPILDNKNMDYILLRIWLKMKLMMRCIYINRRFHAVIQRMYLSQN